MFGFEPVPLQLDFSRVLCLSTSPTRRQNTGRVWGYLNQIDFASIPSWFYVTLKLMLHKYTETQ